MSASAEPAQRSNGWHGPIGILAGGLMLGVAIAWSLRLLPGLPPQAAGSQTFASAKPNFGVFPGDIAPDFQLMTLEGGTATLSKHRGHRVLLNFFASWCQPCRDEMPGVQSQAEAHASHDWVVLGIDVMETREAAATFRDEFDLTFPILLDEYGWVTATYQVKGTPTSLFIDREGMIVERRLGYMSEAEIAQIIESVP